MSILNSDCRSMQKYVLTNMTKYLENENNNANNEQIVKYHPPEF